MSKKSGLYAAKLKVNCMKFVGSKNMEQKEFGNFFTFSIDYDDVVIEKSVPEEERPSEFWGNKDLEFEEGAKISGKKIWGCCNKRPGRIKKGEAGDRSNRHSRQVVDISGEICYAVVITNWRDETTELHPLEYEKQKML